MQVNIKNLIDVDWLTNLLACLKNGKVLLALGILVRILIFWFLRPTNNDDHFGIIQFLVANGRLPIFTDHELAYHPPLYYLLAAPFLKTFGSEKAVQFLSLTLSIASLVILYVLVHKARLIQGLSAQLYSFILACFLPQFVMFTLYVSNDTLAIFLGALVVLQSRRFIQFSTWPECFLLAIVTGLGLLTKSTFLAFLPVLLALVVFMNFQTNRSLIKASWAAGVFLAVAVSLGSYKFVDNYVRFRDPFMNPLDHPAEWITEQQTHYMGLRSYLDINIFRLLMSPALSGDPLSGETTSAYPVLIYATFWYQHIPESNFVGNLHGTLKYLGSLIYAIAIVPTVVFVIGLATLVRGFCQFVKRFDRRRVEDCGLLCLYVAVCLLLSNCVLILTSVIKYHVWSIMQARLLFPSLVGALGAFGVGVEVGRRKRLQASVVNAVMISLLGLFVLYFSSEVGYQIWARLAE